MRKYIVILVLSFAGLFSSLAGNAAEKTDSLKVLFIGNSFTYVNYMPGIVRSLAENDAIPAGVSVKMLTRGGWSLRQHWNSKEEMDVLRSGGWDYVVLQDQSQAPALPTRRVMEGSYPYAHKLDSLAKACNPGVQVIFYMTWSHKGGNRQEIDPAYPLIQTYDGMQLRLATSYLEMAYDNGSLCAPVGLAWQKVIKDSPWVELYTADGQHPSKAGSYLAASTILTVILGRPVESTFDAGLGRDIAAYLQKTASETVLSSPETFNLKLGK